MPQDDLPSTTIESTPHVNPQLDATITSPKQRRLLDDSFKTFFASLDQAESAKDPAPEPKAELEVKAEGSATEPVSEPGPEAAKESVESEPNEAAKEDAKPEVTPSAPATPPATSTPPAAQPPVAPAPAKESAPVPDLESLEPHPAASESQKSQFKQLKEITQKFGAEAKLLRSKIVPLVEDLGLHLTENPEEMGPVLDQFADKIKAWKTGAMSPEIQSELDSLRQLARSMDVTHSEEFIRDYAKPIEVSYHDIIDEMAKYFDAAPEVIKEQFVDPLKTQFKPSQLQAEWWDQQVALMKKAPETIKRKVEQKIAQLFTLQEKHDKRVDELSKSRASYDQWQQQNQQRFATSYENELKDEVEKALASDKKAISGWRPLPLDGVTDPEKRAAIVQHNERFSRLEKRFSNVIGGFNQGPRTAARLGLEFIELEEGMKALADSLKAKHDELETLKADTAKQLKDKEAELATLREEVTKKRKIADAVVKPTAGTAATKPTVEKPKLSDVSGRKGMQKAFDDWKL